MEERRIWVGLQWMGICELMRLHRRVETVVLAGTGAAVRLRAVDLEQVLLVQVLPPESLDLDHVEDLHEQYDPNRLQYDPKCHA